MVTDNFSDKAIEEAFSIKLDRKILKERPKVYGFTIDGASSKDLDDGISLSKKGENYLLQVSIADVAEYVTPNTELFKQAIEKVETHYFQSANDPMLPRILSESRLSLWPDIWKAAITFDLELSPAMDVVDFSFKETAFKSIKKYNYDEFDKILKQNNEPQSESASHLAEISQKLLAKRRAKGALAVYDIKKGIYTNEEGLLLPLEGAMAHHANIVVQEAMILTNKQLAMFFAKNDIPLLYRNHTAKQSAPGRDEIIEQINFAIGNSDYLESLQGRAAVWFNRALYEPTLKGHFGLNEPAYTHATSPIRRVADLINHLQIKAYLRDDIKAFSHSELVVISNEINQRKADYDEERATMFKEKSLVVAMKNFAKNSEVILQEMTIAQFAQVVKAAASSGEMNEALKSEIFRRMAQNIADADLVYKIFIHSAPNREEWKEVVGITNAYMYHTKGMPLQILQIHSQKGILEDFDFEVKTTKKGFAARLSGNIVGEDAVTTEFYSSTGKKDAMQEAAFHFLQPLLELELNMEYENTLEGLKQNCGEELKMPSENFVGKVQDFCMQHHRKKWGEPIYNFQLSGPSHSPIITCDVKLKGPGGTLKEQAIAANKKLAKNMAAEQLYTSIREVLRIVNEDTETECETDNSSEQLPAINDENANYIGLLQEYLQKNKKPLPQYDYAQSGEQHEPVFNCTVSVAFADAPLELTVQGKNKSIAKHNAAKAAYNWIRENVSN